MRLAQQQKEGVYFHDYWAGMYAHSFKSVIKYILLKMLKFPETYIVSTIM